MRLLSGQKEDAELDAETASMLVDHGNQQIFNPQERRMIEAVLNLNQRTVSSIMTSRHDIEHIDLNAPEEEIRQLLERNQHTRLVVTDGDDAEDLLGVVHVIDLLQQSLARRTAQPAGVDSPAAGVPGNLAVVTCPRAVP